MCRPMWLKGTQILACKKVDVSCVPSHGVEDDLLILEIFGPRVREGLFSLIFVLGDQAVDIINWDS